MEAHTSVSARLYDGATGVPCDGTLGTLTWGNDTFFNTLTICGYVNNVQSSFYSVNIPYMAGKQAVVPIYNNEALAFLIKITVSAIGKITWQTVYSVNQSLNCYITNVIGV